MLEYHACIFDRHYKVVNKIPNSTGLVATNSAIINIHETIGGAKDEFRSRIRKVMRRGIWFR